MTVFKINVTQKKNEMKWKMYILSEKVVGKIN